MICVHNLINYDGEQQEYYCIECGDVVPEPPEDWDDEDDQ